MIMNDKNNLSALNSHLFDQMRRLNEDDINDEKLNKEIERTKAMTSIAKEIIANARTVLDAQEAKNELGQNAVLPAMLHFK
jgi:septal ring factor EnvC (AmiA/AmiB activator)